CQTPHSASLPDLGPGAPLRRAYAYGLCREPFGCAAPGAAVRAHDRRGLRHVHGAVLRLALGLGSALEHRPAAPAAHHRRIQDPAGHECLYTGTRRERVHLLLVAQPDRAEEPDLRLLALRRGTGDRRLRPRAAAAGRVVLTDATRISGE